MIYHIRINEKKCLQIKIESQGFRSETRQTSWCQRSIEKHLEVIDNISQIYLVLFFFFYVGN